MSESLIGRAHTSVETIDADRAARYIAVTGDDPDQHRGVAPPLFAVVPAMQSVQAILFGSPASDDEDDPLGIDLLSLLHVDQDVRFLRPLRLGEEVTVRTELVDIGDSLGGESWTATVSLTGEAGPAAEMRVGLLVRGRAAGRPAQMRSTPHPARGAVVAESEVVLASDAPRRYAEASGDTNPIHLDDEVARRAGFPGAIAHGLLTMALGAVAAVDALADGDPGRLARMRLAFARPVLPGATLTFRFYETDVDGTFDLTVRADGARVARNSLVEIRPAGSA